MGSSMKIPDSVHMVVERHGECSRCRPCRNCKDFETKCGYDRKKVSYVSKAYVDWEAAYKDALGKQVSWIERNARKGKGMHLMEAKRSVFGTDLDVIQTLELLHDEMDGMEDVIPVMYNVLELPLTNSEVKGGHVRSAADDGEDEEDDFDEDDLEDDDLFSTEGDNDSEKDISLEQDIPFARLRDRREDEEEAIKNLKRRKLGRG